MPRPDDLVAALRDLAGVDVAVTLAASPESFA